MADLLLWRIKTLIAILILAITSVITFTLTILASFIKLFVKKKQKIHLDKVILINDIRMTKSLEMARYFKRNGFFVIGVTSPKYRHAMSRFSNSFKKIYIIPDAKEQTDQYMKFLIKIVKDNKVDWFIPICAPATEVIDAKIRDYLIENNICKVLHFDEKTTSSLGDKFKFSQWVESLNLRIPKYAKITDLEQIISYKIPSGEKYILKRIKYDPFRRSIPILLTTTNKLSKKILTSLNISNENPWILQKFIEGKEYCAHATIVDNQIKLYTDSNSSSMQLNYQHIGHPLIYKWVNEFIKKSKISTGQICFDFIEDNNGNIFPIECNPRIHSAITSFYNQSDVIRACFENLSPNELPLTPTSSAKMTYWLPEEICRLFKISINLQMFEKIKDILTNILRGKYIIFRLDDPWPAFGIHLHFISLLIPKLINGSRWSRLEFCIGKIVEPGGD